MMLWYSAALQNSLTPVNDRCWSAITRSCVVVRSPPLGTGSVTRLDIHGLFQNPASQCVGLASPVITRPNSASRLFAIISLTFGRLVVAAMLVPFHPKNLTKCVSSIYSLKWIVFILWPCTLTSMHFGHWLWCLNLSYKWPKGTSTSIFEVKGNFVQNTLSATHTHTHMPDR